MASVDSTFAPADFATPILQSDWDTSLARYRAAATSNAIAWAQYQAESSPSAEHQRAMERLGSECVAAQNALLATPAPSGAALSVKLELLFGDEDADGHVPSWTLDAVRPALQDAARLAGSAPAGSPIATLLATYREQVTALNVAVDPARIDELACASDDTLREVSRLRAGSAGAIADKLEAVIEHHAQIGTVALAVQRAGAAGASALAG